MDEALDLYIGPEQTQLNAHKRCTAATVLSQNQTTYWVVDLSLLLVFGLTPAAEPRDDLACGQPVCEVICCQFLELTNRFYIHSRLSTKH